jgi:penicillin-binding protein 1A
MGLGAIAVSPMEMASAYATLAAQGIYSKPWVIRKVVLASGKQDRDAGWGVPERKRVLPDWVAAEVTKILEENMTAGTGTAAYFGRTAAGKTGTTDKHSDAWFCGYTPNLTTTVWVGYPRAQIPMENVHGIAVAGGTFPAQIWHLFMVRALGDTPPLEWPEPKSSAVWRPFTQGQYARYYTYDSNRTYYSPPAATSAAATTTARTAPKPATTAPPPHPPPATTQPPATTAAPPVTTGPEP